MENSPRRIFLQIGIEGKNYNTQDYNDLDKSSMTWCEGEIFESDLEFISVLPILERIKELETEMENEYSVYSEASCRFRIDELKNLLK